MYLLLLIKKKYKIFRYNTLNQMHKLINNKIKSY